MCFKRKKIALRKKNLTVKNFTLEITGFPNENIKTTDIALMFNKITEKEGWGKVTSITKAFEFKNTLGDIIKVSEYRLTIHNLSKELFHPNTKKTKKTLLKRQINFWNYRATRLNNIIKKKLGLAIEENIDYTNMHENKILKAFVSFSDTDTTNNIRKLINKAYSQDKASRCCFRKLVPQDLKFRGTNKLYCKKPDNPSNINWQNLEKSTCTKFSKFCISFFYDPFCASYINVLYFNFRVY